ncbi:acyl-CoA thioesterase [Bradyrhizobium sp. AZCC 2262]|uniref:acyl-CoA thioesterase n=1 Tax=Bradyrhizobium sp. AZCC 2262 TaxID=3117022 RepID=UPI002FEF9C66
MGSLAEDTTVARDGDRLSIVLTEEWGLWGPNGGYLAAVAMRAAGMAAPKGHRPATYSCQFLSSPRFGAVDLVVTPVRQGRSAWCLNIQMLQGDKLCLQAQTWTTDRHLGPEQTHPKIPVVPGPNVLKHFMEYVPKPYVTFPFWSHIESRPVDVYPPHARNPDGPRQRVWQRLIGFDAGGDPFVEATRSLVLIDCMQWPTFDRSLPESPSYTAPSLDLSVWIHKPALKCDWVLIDAHADNASGGLIHGGGRIWSSDGELIATGGSQSLVVGG